MKKLIIALTLLAPMINAESTDLQNSEPKAEITPEMIELAAKFKALHSFCIEEYSAIEALFKDCGSLYAEIYDQLSRAEESGNQSLKEQCLTLQNDLTPAIMDLNELLHRVQDLNVKMQNFNVMLQEATDFQEVVNKLLSIAQEMHSIRVSLEAIKEYESEILKKGLELTNPLDEQ